MSNKFLSLFEAASAEEDYNVEKAFAAKVLQGQAALTQFPYFADYRHTVAIEHACSSGGSVLFLGGGPVPISALLLAIDHHVKVSVVELLPEAVAISRRLIQYLRIGGVSVVQGDGTHFNGYGSYGTIYIALEAGNTREAKEGIFMQIAKQANPNATILVRGSSTENFLNVDEFVHDHFEVVRKVPVFSGLSVTYVLHCRVKKPVAAPAPAEPTAL